MKGDRVIVVVDAGANLTREFVIEATKAGRRIEFTTGPRFTDVQEMTRTGHAVRSSRFMSSRVIALVEEPVE